MVAEGRVGRWVSRGAKGTTGGKSERRPGGAVVGGLRGSMGGMPAEGGDTVSDSGMCKVAGSTGRGNSDSGSCWA